MSAPPGFIECHAGITFTAARNRQDLEGILQLQKANLPANIDQETMAREGFVTVKHNYAQLKKLNDIESQLVALKDEKIIGYLLAMTPRSGTDIPVLVPMFQLFETVLFQNKPVAQANYIVVGQACIAKAFRGQGMLDQMYAAYKELFQQKYDFAVTEIAVSNKRSLNAHKRIGFREIHSYAAGDTLWSVLLWPWRKD